MENVEINILKFGLEQGETGEIPFRTAISVNPKETVEELVDRILVSRKGDVIYNVWDTVIEIRAVKSIKSQP